MKLRALAIIAALAVPGIASAVPADYPPTTTPTNNAPNDNTPNNHPTEPTPSQSPGRAGTPSDTSPTDRAKNDKMNDKTANDRGDTGKNAKLSDADTKIVAHLHHVNQMEIQAGQLAERAGSARVKDYGKTLVNDHQSADKDLTAFARSHKVMAIPADKAATDADRQDDKDMMTAMAHLKTLKGAEFDKEFLNMMVSGHDKELTKIDVAISGATDSDLKNMLQSVKPVLQRHADQARDLQKSPQAANDSSTQLPSTRSSSKSSTTPSSTPDTSSKDTSSNPKH